MLFRFRYVLLTLLSVLLLHYTVQAQVIWEEDFSGYGNKEVVGLNKNTDNPAPDWTSSAGDCDGGGSIQGNLWVGNDHWGTTTNGRFLCQDVEGLTCCGLGGTSDNELITELINIPTSTALARMAVQISMDGSQNSFEPCSGTCDNAEDPITVEISLDGAPYTEVCNNGSNCGLNVFEQKQVFNYIASNEFIEANTVQFKITTGNKAQDEKIYLDAIRLEAIPDFTITSASGCTNSNIQVSVSGGSDAVDYQYAWSSTGLVSSNEANATYNFASTGQQPISVDVTAGSCTRSVSSSINVLNSVGAQLAGPDGLCVGDTGTFELTGPSASNGSVMWDAVLGARIDDAAENPNRYQFGTAGNFTIKATVTDGGCSAEITKAITVEPRPTISVSASESFACNGAPITLTASATGFNTINWSTDADFSNILSSGTSITVNPTTTTTYYARAIGNFCEEITNITIPTLQSPLVEEALVCDRTNGIQLDATLNQTGTTYEWSEDPNFTTVFASTPTTTVNPTQTTDYFVRITNGACVITDTITVYAFDTGLPQQIEICGEGASTLLTANSNGLGKRWAWSKNPNFAPILSADSAYRVSPTITTTYYLKITTDFCDYQQAITVVPFIPPVLPNINACPGDQVTLGPQNPGNYPGATYLWKPLEFINQAPTTANPITTSLQETTTYTATMTFGVCQAELFQTVRVEFLGDFLPYQDSIFYCFPNQPKQIEANTGGTPVQYEWSENPTYTPLLTTPNDSSISYAPNGNFGNIYLRVTTANGCQFEDQVKIGGVGALPTVLNDYFYCRNEGVQLLLDTGSTAYKRFHPKEIFWSPAFLIEPPNTRGFEATAFPTGYAEVKANLVFTPNCTRQVTAVMDISPVFYKYPPDIFVNKNSLFEGESFTVENLNPPPKPTIFTAQEDSIYFTWLTSGIEGDDSIAYQTYEASNELDYVYYKMEDPFCSYIDSVDIRSRMTEKECREPFVPNAFSPNEDGANDRLKVRAPNLEALHFTVYDRWGATVYESEIQSEGWDGTYKGEPLNPGVYVYIVEAACGQEIYNLKGNTTLLR